MTKLLCKKHIEIVQMVHMISRFPKSKNNLLNKFGEDLIEGKLDYEAAITYVFLTFYEVTKVIHGEDLKSSDLLKLIDICNIYLKDSNDNWWINLVKCLIYLRLPLSMQKEEDLSKSIEDMIKEQELRMDKEPYFVIPYIYSAIFYSNRGDSSAALKKLREALQRVPKGRLKVDELYPHLYLPIREYYFNCRVQEQKEELDLIRDVVHKYFIKDM